MVSLSIYPFSDFNQYFTSIYILEKFKHLHIKTITSLINQTLSSEFSCSVIFNFSVFIKQNPKKYGLSFFAENIQNKIDTMHDLYSEPIIFTSLSTKCIFCSCVLIDGSEYKAECYYYNNPPANVRIISKKCLSKSCKAEHFLNYADKLGERKLFKNFLSLKYFSISHETIFELKVLFSFESHLLNGHSSFKGFADAYNCFFNSFLLYINGNEKRCILNRKRLAEVWFYYRFILFYKELNKDLENFPMPYIKNLNNELVNIKASLQPYFIKKWSGESHSKCVHSLCSKAIVIDGNHKVNRSKCFYDLNSFQVPELKGMFEYDPTRSFYF